MDVRNEILDYINQKELTGALLLTGQWGCGKSYLIKEIAKELNESKKAAVAVISLFGLDSVAAINKRVKDEYLNFKLGSVGKTVKKLSKVLTKTAKDGMAVASIAAEGNPGLAAASQGLSAVMSYDVFSFIEVKNTIGKEEKDRRFVIVFDDLERSNIGEKDLLGTLNEYVENKFIKVIIVADEDKINGEDYKNYKEKLISRTIRLKADYERIIDSIINNYHQSSAGYKRFLKENTDLLKQVFAESNSDNIRTIKCIIADFERFYNVWEESGIDNTNMKWALYTFAAEVFLYRDPPQSTDESLKKEDAFSFMNQEKKKFPSSGRNSSSFTSFRNWIREGQWEKDFFLSELKRRYCKEERTPFERFIGYGFWDLQQNDIKEGLPEALKRAYNGELSSDDLLILLEKIHFLNVYKIDLPCNVDYQKLEEGFDKRIEKIKNGTIKMQENHRFAEEKNIDPEAISLNNKIKRSSDIIYAWILREKLIHFLNGDPSVSRFDIKGGGIERFDDELFETFTKRYSHADNTDKREYAVMLLDMNFCDSIYSTEEDILFSKSKFEELLKWLNDQESTDEITKLINKSFADAIKNLRIMQPQKESE